MTSNGDTWAYDSAKTHPMSPSQPSTSVILRLLRELSYNYVFPEHFREFNRKRRPGLDLPIGPLTNSDFGRVPLRC